MHVCGTYKNGTSELICRAGIETHMQRTDMWRWRGRKGGMNWEVRFDINTLPQVSNTYMY